ncbi:MAG: tetratricopeptide repeat protein [Phycisphaeraceae bacterium]
MVRVPVRWCVSAVLGGCLACSAFGTPVEDAQRAFDQGEYNRAATIYEQAAERSPGLLEDEAFMAGWRKAESRIAYATGVDLAAEREYDAAVNLFMTAVAKDGDYQEAFDALEDARKAGINQHLLVAMESADKGDLLTAKRRLERSLVLGGGAYEQITTALASIADPASAFDEKILDRLAEAQRLASDRQWALSEQQLQSLVRDAPLLLPARSELSRVAGIRQLSVTLTDEAAALIAEQRLSPALEKLAGATRIWPYNERAAQMLESVEAKIKRALALVEEADALQAQGDWRSAYEKVTDALAIDPSQPDARAMRSKVRIGLVRMLCDQALAALEQGDTDQARRLIERGDQFWPNNRWSRQAFADYQLALAEAATQAGHTGEAYLRTLLASRQRSLGGELNMMERAFVDDARATYSYDVALSTPTVGVGSADLLGAMATQAHGWRPEPASCILMLHDGRELDRGAKPADADAAGYRVHVQITETDIDLRQRNNGTIATNGLAFGQNSGAFNSHYWEKFGEVRVAVRITDAKTGDAVASFNGYRWANYTDRQQYVIGNTWREQYWTLPTDASIAARLARDLAAQVHPQVVEAITLAKAKAMWDGATMLSHDFPYQAMNQRVASVILAGQINPRQAKIELWKMAKQIDGQESDQAK